MQNYNLKFAIIIHHLLFRSKFGNYVYQLIFLNDFITQLFGYTNIIYIIFM